MSPSINHSYICRKIIIQVEQTQHWEAWPQLTLDIGQGYIPDVCIFPKDAIKPDLTNDSTKCTVIPTVAIEVLSPSQGMQELVDKSGILVAGTIPCVWVVDPYMKSVMMVTSQGRQVIHSAPVEFEGLSVDFQQVFEG